MQPSFEVIRELFDLPGTEGLSSRVSKTRGKRGRDSRESSRLGKQAMSEEDYEDAIFHFRRAVELSDEKSPWLLMDLGGAYAAADNAPQAFRQYLKARRIQRSGELAVSLAALYQQFGRYHDAVARLKEAVELEPESAYSHYKLAEALRRAGYKREAVHAAQVAVSCAPDQAFYHYWLGDLFIDIRKFQEAVDALHAAIELSPGDDQLFFLASQAFWGAGRQQEAVRSIRLASDINAESCLYHGMLEAYLRAMGLDAEADQERPKAAKMDAYDVEVLNRAAVRLKIKVASP